MTDEERKKLLMPDPGADVSADSLNSPDQQAAAASLLAGKFGPAPSALPGVDPSVAGAQAAAMMGPPKPYQQMGLGQQMNTPIPTGMPEAGGTLANLFENANRARTMSPGVTVQQPGGATLTADSAADYAKKINNVLDSAQALKAQDAASTNAGASPASVPTLGGGAPGSGAPAPKDFNHYLEMIAGSGGGPGWAAFAASPDERLAAAQMMHQDAKMQQQSDLAAQTKSVEMAKIQSAEKIAGMLHQPDADAKKKRTEEVKQLVRHYDTHYADAVSAGKLSPEQAKIDKDAAYFAAGIDPKTKEDLVKPKGTEVPPSTIKATAPNPEEMQSASRTIRKLDITDQNGKALGGIDATKVYDVMKDMPPDQAKAMVELMKREPEKYLKPILSQAGTHRMEAQPRGDVNPDAIGGRYPVKVDPSTWWGQGVHNIGTFLGTPHRTSPLSMPDYSITSPGGTKTTIADAPNMLGLMANFSQKDRDEAKKKADWYEALLDRLEGK